MTLSVDTAQGSSPNVRDAAEKARGLIANVEKAIFGKRDTVTLAVIGWLAEGHLLLEDVPGTGKTTLSRALARSVDASLRKIQFTSDMLPSDVVGVSVFHSHSGEFRFEKGPIFGNVILADELNRATPRTQSALLECMNEAEVTVDGRTHSLPRPFLVVATQNPLEYEGTYPLPESQLDRFHLRLSPGYPDREHERALLAAHELGRPVDTLEPVMTPEELASLQREVRRVQVAPSLVEYLLEFIDATRDPTVFALGASPRAALALYRLVQALALTSGRDYAIPDDVKQMIVPTLAHRLIPRHAEGTLVDASREHLEGLLDDIEAPPIP